MILQLKHETGTHTFALGDEGFPYEYNNGLSYAESGPGRTHPNMLMWQGGEIGVIQINLKLMAGVFIRGDEVVDPIPDARALKQKVEAMHNMSLPPPGTTYLTPVIVSIGGGQNGLAWYRIPAFVRSFRVVFKGPWDITNGM